jgi:hypothetical protein
MAASAFDNRGVASVTRGGAGDTDAGGDEHLTGAGGDGHRERLENTFGERFRLTHDVLPVEQNEELVTAQTGHHLGRAVGGHQPSGHGDEHLVAHLVAQGVVDGLEPVEVEHEQGDRARTPLVLGQGVGESVGEQCPVGQPVSES